MFLLHTEIHQTVVECHGDAILHPMTTCSELCSSWRSWTNVVKPSKDFVDIEVDICIKLWEWNLLKRAGRRQDRWKLFSRRRTVSLGRANSLRNRFSCCMGSFLQVLSVEAKTQTLGVYHHLDHYQWSKFYSTGRKQWPLGVDQHRDVRWLVFSGFIPVLAYLVCSPEHITD
jgi:hypothetical protein